jgi:hypothetical protein
VSISEEEIRQVLIDGRNAYNTYKLRKGGEEAADVIARLVKIIRVLTGMKINGR